MSDRRRVCVVVASRANYARIKSALAAVKAHPDLELQIIAGASALLERFGNSVDVMAMDGYAPDATIRLIIEGGNPATMAERLGTLVGLSDHTPGIYTSIAAAALGAAAVEKHFTLSRLLYGPDHHASLEPEDLRRLVDGVRQVEAALGSPEKRRDPGHDPVRATFEKSVVTAGDIPAGTVIAGSMLTTKRPGTGIPAVRIDEIVGRRAARDLDANHLLETADLV